MMVYTASIQGRKEKSVVVYRNELKHVIDRSDKAAIMANLRAVARLDGHAGETGSYMIRSLYFDNVYDRAL